MELYWNFPYSKMSKMESEMEVSILELYYSVILCVCERRKEIVCGKVAIDITPNISDALIDQKTFYGIIKNKL